MKTSQEFRQQKISELARACRENGLPLTPQRQTVLEALAGRSDHPSADELFDEVKDRLRGISRATVYRVLETLVRLGVARRISTSEARARFDAHCGRHHHVQCARCGKVEDLNDLPLDDLMPENTFQGGFRLLDYSVQFSGLCTDCQDRP